MGGGNVSFSTVSADANLFPTLRQPSATAADLGTLSVNFTGTDTTSQGAKAAQKRARNDKKAPAKAASQLKAVRVHFDRGSRALAAGVPGQGERGARRGD